MRRWWLALLLGLLLLPAPAWADVGDWQWFVDTDFDTADTLDLAMAASQQGLCQVLDHTDNVDVYTYDGTTEKLVESFVGSRSERVYFPVSDTERYRIKAGTGAANNAYTRVHCRREK